MLVQIKFVKTAFYSGYAFQIGDTISVEQPDAMRFVNAGLAVFANTSETGTVKQPIYVEKTPVAPVPKRK